MKKISILFVLSVMLALSGVSQTITQPNYALKSHPTLEIRKIESSGRSTKVFLSIENQIEGGSFCADRNISIICSEGTRLRLISSEGIPVCPDQYIFRNKGERLDFTLTFPGIGSDIKEVDIVEECNENCFSFYGVILDNDINTKTDAAFVLAEAGESVSALAEFEKIAQEEIKKGMDVHALQYLNIIQLSEETGNKVKASDWYKKLTDSGIQNLKRYIEFLNEIGISY